MTKAILRYHEIALKGGNRAFFESRLRKNLEAAVEGLSVKVRRRRDHFQIDFEDLNREEVARRLEKVFGIANFSFVELVAPDLEKVVERGIELVQEAVRSAGLSEATFRVTVHRSDKNFPQNSMELAREISSRVLPAIPGLKVNLKSPQVQLWVDWGREEVYLYARKFAGPGGLPVGTSGKVVSLLSAGFDSPVASWRMMKRGAKVVFVHFHSYPAVGHESIDNVARLVEALKAYQGPSKLYLIPLIEYQKIVVAKAPAPLRVLLYRRMMLRLAQRVMRYERAKALVTGESLAQVASQTLDNLHVVDVLAERPVLRPLIAMDKQEIIDAAERIGTAEISKEPYEDCCSLYVPRAPALSAKVPELESAEASLDVEQYEQQLWDQRELRKF